MRWHPEKNDIVIFAEGPKLWCSMAVMVVKNKQPFVMGCSRCMNTHEGKGLR
jgi:hypothetical protein